MVDIHSFLKRRKQGATELRQALVEGIAFAAGRRFAYEPPPGPYRVLGLAIGIPLVAAYVIGLIVLARVLGPEFTVSAWILGIAGSFLGLFFAYGVGFQPGESDKVTQLILRADGMEFVHQTMEADHARIEEIVKLPLEYFNLSGMPNIDARGMVRYPLNLRCGGDRVWLGGQAMTAQEAFQRLGYRIPKSKDKPVSQVDWLALRPDLFELSIECISFGENPSRAVFAHQEEATPIFNLFCEIWAHWRAAFEMRGPVEEPSVRNAQEAFFRQEDRAALGAHERAASIQPTSQTPLVLERSQPASKVLAFRISLFNNLPPICVYTGREADGLMPSRFEHDANWLGRLLGAWLPGHTDYYATLTYPVNGNWLFWRCQRTWLLRAVATSIFGVMAYLFLPRNVLEWAPFWAFVGVMLILLVLAPFSPAASWASPLKMTLAWWAAGLGVWILLANTVRLGSELGQLLLVFLLAACCFGNGPPFKILYYAAAADLVILRFRNQWVVDRYLEHYGVDP